MQAKGVSGFGIAAIVIGIIAVLFAWIPYVGLLSIPLALIGIVLAVVGFFISLIGRHSSVGMPFAGGFVCALAIALSLFSTIGATAVVGVAANEAVKVANASAVERSATTPEIRKPATPVAAPAARTVTTKPAVTASPATKPAAVTQPADVDELARVGESLRVAKDLASQEETRAMESLRATPAYKRAASELATAEAMVKQGRQLGSANLPDLSSKWIAAKAKVANLERDAIGRDKAIADARANVAALETSFAQLERSISIRKATEANAREAEAKKKREAESAAAEAAKRKAMNPVTTLQNVVTLTAFNLITTDSTLAEVQYIIGSTGDVVSDSQIGDIRTVMLAWQNRDGSNMNAMFQNGKLVSKAQFGLR